MKLGGESETERKLGRVDTQDNGRKVTSLEKKTNQSIKERSKQVKVKDKGTMSLY